MGRIPIRTGRRFAVGLCVMLILSGVYCLKAGSGEDMSPSRIRGASLPRQEVNLATKRDPTSFRIIPRVTSQQAAIFSLFRTPPERLPASVRGVMRRASYGTNWDLAQRLPVVVRGDFWLIPGDGVVCILAHQKRLLSQSCAPMSIAKVAGTAIAILAAHPRLLVEGGRRLVVGVGPGRARKVFVHTGRFVSMRSVGRSGAFILRDVATNPPDSLTFR
jgi:hypothetical protein